MVVVLQMTKIRFYCKCCNSEVLFYDHLEDPTTGSGACKLCGSHNWIMRCLYE